MGLVTVLKRPEVSLADRKLLLPEEWSAVLTAEEVVREAERAAADIRAEAVQARELERQRGYEAGLDEGRRVGAERLAELAVDHARLLDSLQQTIVETVLRVLEEVLVGAPREAFFEAALRRARQLCRQHVFLTLHVSPVDEEPARTALDRWFEDAGLANPVDLRVDAGLKPMACLVESDVGMVDGSLQVQLAAIRKALTRELGAEFADVRGALAEEKEGVHVR